MNGNFVRTNGLIGVKDMGGVSLIQIGNGPGSDLLLIFL